MAAKPSENIPEKYLYNSEQAADYLGITVRTIRHHLTKVADHEDKLHPVEPGNSHYLGSQLMIFTKTELDRFKKQLEEIKQRKPIGRKGKAKEV